MNLDRELVIWDGGCGFCAEVTRRLQAKDKVGAFDFQPNFAVPSPPMTPEIQKRSNREILLITRDSRVLGGAKAVFTILSRLGWGWFAKLLASPPLVWPMELGYRIVARNRGWISRRFFGGNACALPVKPGPEKVNSKPK